MTHVVGKPAPSSQRLNQLLNYASSPGHSKLALMRNLPFSFLAAAVGIHGTHCAYPWRDGQAKLVRREEKSQENKRKEEEERKKEK